MKLIVDTNIIISALIKDSITRKIIHHIKADLFCIPLQQKELEKYKSLILRRSNLDELELKNLISQLYQKMIPLKDSIILSKMPTAIKIMDHIDPNDTQFIAAALSIKADIWSDDKHFQKQNKVKIRKTKDLVTII